MGDKRRDVREEERPDDAERVARARAVRTLPHRGTSAEADRLGREQQRRATAYARARGQL